MPPGDGKYRDPKRGEPKQPWVKHSKLTPDNHKRVIDAVRKGATFRDAAKSIGVHESTLETWKRRGREETEGKYYDLVQDIATAEAECKIEVIGGIVEAAKKDWKAGMTFLERKYPNEFARTERVNLGGSDEPVKVTLKWE